ncbi:MAG: helix-turn-helix domain-containing protein [Patescibacteria group bacterium]|nr:helix-turn-helix domain-containing protein [Patescibacteria group bacterium]
MAKKEFIKEKDVKQILLKYLKEGAIPNIFAVTGRLGIEYGGKKEYYEKAKTAAQKQKIVGDNKVYWIPLILESKTIAVIGIKAKEKPTAEIGLIEGLFNEIKYELFLREQTESQADPKSNFVKELLLSDKIKNLEEAIDRGDIIGVNLRAPQAIILVRVPGLFKHWHDEGMQRSFDNRISHVTKKCHKLSSKILESFRGYDQNIITCLEPDLFAVLKWAKGPISTTNTIKFYKEKAEYIRKTFEKETGLPVIVGVGQYYPGLSGLRKSYNDAQIALDLGEKLWGPSRSYHITDVGMFASFSQNVSYERRCELAHQILGEILTDKDLKRTVSIFLSSNMNLTDAAKKLHVHRNTLIYRLDKIKKEIGLDPRNFSDAVEMKLGLMLFGNSDKNC